MVELAERFLAGDRRALARAITWVENGMAEARSMLQAVYQQTGRAQIIGITGPPGSGKSTLVDRLAAHYRAAGRTVAIIAVDPSSPFTGGAILGDRIRMQRTLGDPGVFMRSLASRGHLGGLSRATGDVIALADAFGFDIVLVETVGAGQSEVEIMGLAHSTVVVLAPGLGDDIQAIKAGILEIGDVFAINKADREGADRTATEIEMMLDLAYMGEPGITRWGESGPQTAVGTAHLERLDRFGHHGAMAGHPPATTRAASPPAVASAATAAASPELPPAAADPRFRHGVATPGSLTWRPPVLKTVARDGRGAGDLAERLAEHWQFLSESGQLEHRRERDARAKVLTLVRDRILDQVATAAAGSVAAVAGRVAGRELDPYAAADAVLREHYPWAVVGGTAGELSTHRRPTDDAGGDPGAV